MLLNHATPIHAHACGSCAQSLTFRINKFRGNNDVVIVCGTVQQTCIFPLDTHTHASSVPIRKE